MTATRIIPLTKLRIIFGRTDEDIQCKLDFAERLKQARLKANLSRKELGDTINLSPNGYGQYESARREPSLLTLKKIAIALNCSVDWLLGLETTGQD